MKKILFLSVLFLSMTLYAQEAKEPLQEPLPASEANIKLAAELAKYGYANKSALSLIQAARMAVDNNFQEEAAKKDNN